MQNLEHTSIVTTITAHDGNTGLHQAVSEAYGKSDVQHTTIAAPKAENNAEAKRIETAILAGNAKDLEHEMAGFSRNPNDALPALEIVAHDLKRQGIMITYGVGGEMLPGDKAFHNIGTLTIFSDKGGKAVEVETDPRTHACVGGPIEVKKNGDYTNNEVAFMEDPGAVLRSMAKHHA